MKHTVSGGSWPSRTRRAWRFGERRQAAGATAQADADPAGRWAATGRAPYSAAKFGVEGFSEVLATEMGPLGVRVTIIEPGEFRTDFAGASTKISEGSPAYADTVGKNRGDAKEL